VKLPLCGNFTHFFELIKVSIGCNLHAFIEIAFMTSPKRFDMQTFIARFGCGFLFGGLVGGFGNLQSGFLIGFLIGGIICGLLAWRFGDDFWKILKNWL
jgi:hypothetical protein